ncbi:MAG: SDR family oxidoreductase [Terriglobales bacterium]
MASMLVTGASSGIGAAVARRFGAEGWQIIGASRRPAPAELRSERWIQADLAAEAGIAAVARACGATSLDAVVHSAGDFLVAPIALTTAEEFERIWRITVWSRHTLLRALLPLLEAGARAPARAIIHIASLAAHRDFPDETAYISAMHAVIGLARAQDAELRARGIRAAVVSPGTVRTPLTLRSFGEAALAGALAPDDIAASVWQSVATIRAGGFIPEIVHLPQNST